MPNRNILVYSVLLGCTIVAGADVNIQDSRGRSALHIGILYGYNTIASRLLNANAAIDLQVSIFHVVK